jgi:hypothetical protein
VLRERGGRGGGELVQHAVLFVHEEAVARPAPGSRVLCGGAVVVGDVLVVERQVARSAADGAPAATRPPPTVSTAHPDLTLEIPS